MEQVLTQLNSMIDQGPSWRQELCKKIIKMIEQSITDPDAYRSVTKQQGQEIAVSTDPHLIELKNLIESTIAAVSKSN